MTAEEAQEILKHWQDDEATATTCPVFAVPPLK